MSKGKADVNISYALIIYFKPSTSHETNGKGNSEKKGLELAVEVVKH